MAKNSAEFQNTDPLAEAVEHDEPELSVETRLAQFQEKLEQALHGLAQDAAAVKDDPAAHAGQEIPAITGLKSLQNAFDGLEHPSPEARQELAAAAAPQALKELNQALGLAEPNPNDPAQAGMQYLEKSLAALLGPEGLDPLQQNIQRGTLNHALNMMEQWQERGYDQPMDYEFMSQIKGGGPLCQAGRLLTGLTLPKTMDALELNPAAGLEFHKDPASDLIIPQLQGRENPVFNQTILDSYSNFVYYAEQNNPESFQRTLDKQAYVDESLEFFVKSGQDPRDLNEVYFHAQFNQAMAVSDNAYEFGQNLAGHGPSRIGGATRFNTGRRQAKA